MGSVAAAFFYLLPAVTSGQNSVWLDKDLKILEDSTEAVYFYNTERVERFVLRDSTEAPDSTSMPRLVDPRVAVYHIYYRSGELYRTTGYLEKFGGKKEGKEKEWDISGQLIAQGSYEDGSKTGVWKTWYADGTPKTEIDWTPDGQIVLQFYDSIGQHLVTDGNGEYFYTTEKYTHRGVVENGKKSGLWTGYEKDRLSFSETYDAGNLIEGTSFLEDGTEVKYTEIIRSTKYKGGMSGVYDLIRRELVYPATSLRNGIQGKVIVEFLVDQDGNPTKLRVLRSPDAETAKEALRVMSKMGLWEPALLRGIPAEQSVILPIDFRLQD